MKTTIILSSLLFSLLSSRNSLICHSDFTLLCVIYPNTEDLESKCEGGGEDSLPQTLPADNSRH